MEIAQKIIEMLHRETLFTDANLTPGQPIMYRSAAGYQPLDDEPVSQHDMERFISMPGVGGQDWRERMQEAGNTLEVAQTLSTSRLRCSVYETDGEHHRLRIAIRRLPLTVPELDTLGVPKLLTRTIAKGKGLFLITGPTGAGKTTTLATLIDWVNRRMSLHIQTIEQPIEYVHSYHQSVISQCEVPTNMPSFEAGVEAALRHRPDIIAIGEIRNRETVSAALHAATSGHLVLGTMHTNSCEETINAVLQFFDGQEAEQKRVLLASALNGIISQALVPAIEGDRLHLAYELMNCTPAISLLIRQNKIAQIGNAILAGRDDGMCLLNDTLSALYREKKISLTAAYRAAYTNEGLPLK